jgi:hypothetical protein
MPRCAVGDSTKDNAVNSKDLAAADELEDFSELQELGWEDENYVQVGLRGCGAMGPWGWLRRPAVSTCCKASAQACCSPVHGAGLGALWDDPCGMTLWDDSVGVPTRPVCANAARRPTL